MSRGSPRSNPAVAINASKYNADGREIHTPAELIADERAGEAHQGRPRRWCRRR